MFANDVAGRELNGADRGPAARSRGWSVAATVGVGLEAGVLLVAAVAYGLHALSLPEPAFAVGLAAFFSLSAAGLIAVARALVRGARWAVSAAVTWQAVQVLAGVNLTGIRPWLGLPTALLAVAVGVAVVVGSRDVLRGRR